MSKKRALTLDALRVMNAVDRRGSFAAVDDELGKVPSSLSYTMQKLEEELDVVLFDRSGHPRWSPEATTCHCLLVLIQISFLFSQPFSPFYVTAF